MSKTKLDKIIVVLGPNASGKSELAVKIAKRIGGEVISADSRQTYRGLNIGSGKITKREMHGIKHHLLDVASPRGLFTVSRWRSLAKRATSEILKKGKVPIAAGGTGLYIDALLYDTPLPEVSPNHKLRTRLEKKNLVWLYKELKRLDPRRAGTIEAKNKRRLVRALEIVMTTGAPVPALSERRPAYEALKIGIARPPEELKKRIRTRLAERLKQGMLREVKKLHTDGLSWKRLDALGLEYRYASRHLQGLISEEEMIQKIETESWKYARRQMTWWRKDKEIKWVKDAAKGLALINRQFRA